MSMELERELYRKMLELAREEDFEALLRSALHVITELACARHGYLELRDPYRDDEPKRWSCVGTPLRRRESFEAVLSSGVIQSAMACGETIVTVSAMDDPRFKDRDSVKNQELAAVLCAPIGPVPVLGVIYLEGRSTPGPFTEADRKRCELCAAQLAIVADRLMLRRRHLEAVDGGSAFRAKLLEAGIVGESAALRKALDQILIAAPLEVSVLLTGPTGSGKSLFAEVIHANSRRSGGPFVALNCATLPDSLLESELFGVARGAHSTAQTSRVGKISAAEGGTLFLDEVGELSAQAQAKLLQVLQSKQYYALGSNRVETANVRIIAATNRDLLLGVRDGTFREDLYYRLRVFPIHIAALDERPEDIAPLVTGMCQRAFAANNWPPIPVSKEALQAIQSASWPGNVRELGNVLETAVIRASVEQAPCIECRHIFPDQVPSSQTGSTRLHDATRRFQRDHLHRTLDAVEWNVSVAASRLGIARSYLYKLIHFHGLRKGS